MTDEIWRDIDGYEGLYQVSNFGRVKSFHRSEELILTPAYDKDGYYVLVLKRNGSKQNVKVHRLVATAFIPNPDGKPQVNHIDGNPQNNHVDNLEWVTGHENMQHAIYTGLIPTGEKNYQAKLTNAQVRYIRSNPENMTVTQLAKFFGVDKMVISNVQLGKSYKNAGGEIRVSQKHIVPKEIRETIRRVCKPYDANFGVKALARKYRVNETTIYQIIREND